MICLTFVQPDGAETSVTVNPGQSVMQAALANNIAGITAECNGSAACATCHAFFDETVLAKLPAMADHEDDMLEFAASERQAGSRLSCQIPVTMALDGAKIRLPEMQ